LATHANRRALSPSAESRGNAELPPLPHNLVAERSVLGSVLFDNNALKIAAERLRPDDFYIPRHRRIFKRMLGLAEKQRAIDHVTLVEDPASLGEFDASEWADYLLELTHGLPRVTNVAHYAQIVKAKSVLRSLISSAASIQQQATSEEDPLAIAENAVATFSLFADTLKPSADAARILNVPDMPEAVLDGRLGEICSRRLLSLGFPIAYAWPALVAVAGSLVPTCQSRTNLFVALVGDIATGKSSTIRLAFSVLGVEAPMRHDLMAGSAEGLMERLGDANGEARIVSVDELKHLLSKSKIDNASFPTVLNRAFYDTAFELVAARGRRLPVNCRLSVLGGVVEADFAQCFSSATVYGLHDRFIFGRCPQPFEYSWRPFEGSPEPVEPCGVAADPDVFDERDAWLRTIPALTPRHAEHALRVATIAAAFDGRSILYAKHLAAARAFADYQARVRAVLKPNPGENPDAIAANSILAVLGTEWRDERAISRRVHLDRLGPGVFRRAIENLVFVGDIERGLEGRKHRIRRID
jgi:hypothetical protein